jgi:hypothetical protein
MNRYGVSGLEELFVKTIEEFDKKEKEKWERHGL